MNDDERFAAARDQTSMAVGRYMGPAQAAVDMLLKAAREKNPAGGAHVVRQLAQVNSADLWMLVLGQLASQVVAAENAAREAAEQRGKAVITLDPKAKQEHHELWMTSAEDQIKAAAEEGNYRLMAQLAVDAQLRALLVDDKDPALNVDLDHVLKAMMILDQNALILVSGEAVYRLLNQKRGTP